MKIPVLKQFGNKNRSLKSGRTQKVIEAKIYYSEHIRSKVFKIYNQKIIHYHFIQLISLEHSTSIRGLGGS